MSGLRQHNAYFVITSFKDLLDTQVLTLTLISTQTHQQERQGAHHAEMKEQNSGENLSAGATGGGCSTMVSRSS